MVESPCPGCRRPVKARDDQVGRRVKCSKCKTRFHVPADARDVLDFDDAPARRRRGHLGRRLLAVFFLGLAVAGAVGGTVLFLQSQPPADPTPVPAAEQAAAPGTDAPAPPTASGNPGAAAPRSARKAPTPPAFSNARSVAFEPLRDQPEPIQPPLSAVALDVPFAAVRRAFPAAERDADPAVLWESRAGFQGVGRKLSLTLFSPQTGQRAGGIEFDADGAKDPPCDLSADGGRFASAPGLSTLTVWDTKTGAKLLDHVDPFTGRADGSGAVLFAGPADRVAVVRESAGVRVWDIGAKSPAGEYVLPGAVGKTVAAGRAGGAVVVMAGGAVHRVTLRPAVEGAKLADLGPGVGRPIAVAGSPGGKVAVAFTGAGPTPDTFVAAVRPDGTHPVYRWPAGVGDPVAAGWCGETLAAFGTSTGAAVWFEAEGDSFRPLAVARVPGDKAVHVAGEDHWSLLPGPGGKAVLIGLAMPPQGLVDPLEGGARQRAVTVRLGIDGLFK